MIFKTLVAVSILLNSILIHIEWKRIENLEKWMLHLLEQTDDELLRRWKGADEVDDGTFCSYGEREGE